MSSRDRIGEEVEEEAAQTNGKFLLLLLYHSLLTLILVLILLSNPSTLFLFLPLLIQQPEVNETSENKNKINDKDILSGSPTAKAKAKAMKKMNKKNSMAQD